MKITRLASIAGTFLIAVAVPLASAHAQRAPATAGTATAGTADPRIDRIFARYTGAATPGCDVGVVRDGRMIYRRGYGMADLDHDLPNGKGMVYYVGSVSKQFTAAAIALLALDGRLSLDDPVRKWVPELPDYGTPLTIRHLVHHQSGIRDIYALMALRGDRMEDVFPDSQALALIVRQKGTAFTPGTQYSYSNSGYFLLGLVVRRASGQSLHEFTQARIFGPLGMTHTHFHDDGMHVLKGRALSYAKDREGQWRLAYLANFDKVGAGGLWTTVDDLAKWDANYYTHQVGGDALQAMIHTRGVLANGDTLPYAFGNVIGTWGGTRVTQHTGSLMGYQAYIGRFPDRHLSVLLTCNAEDAPTERLGHEVADVFLGSTLAKSDDSLAAATAAPATAARQAAVPSTASTSAPVATDEPAYAGRYYSEDLDVAYTVARASDGGLTISSPRRAPVPLVAEGAGSYRMGGYTVRFDRGAAANAPVLVLTVPRVGEMRMERRER